MDTAVTPATRNRTPHWQKIGIEVRELKNRRWVGRGPDGKATYRSFESSWQVVIPAKVTGSSRVRRQFSDEKKAISYAEGQADLHRNSGPRAFTLSDFEREDAAKAMPILRELDMTFFDAAQFARRHLRPESGDITIKDLAARIVSEKKRKNLRPDSLRTLRWHLTKIEEDFGADRLVKTISRDEVRKWVEALQSAGLKARNLLNYTRYARQFFKYSHTHKFRADDPTALLESPIVEWKAPSILTVDETKRLLRTAMLADHSKLLPALTLQLFVGGLRTAEVVRLKWADIDLVGRKVDISPAVGKNRRDGDWRTAEIPESAVQFLILHGPREGKVTPPRYKDRMTVLHKAAGFTDYDATHKNSKRHAFGSYGCKLHGPSWVQDQMGNTNRTFMRCYRNARVTEAEATEYFSLTPDNVGTVADVEQMPVEKGA